MCFWSHQSSLSHAGGSYHYSLFHYFTSTTIWTFLEHTGINNGKWNEHLLYQIMTIMAILNSMQVGDQKHRNTFSTDTGLIGVLIILLWATQARLNKNIWISYFAGCHGVLSCRNSSCSEKPYQPVITLCNQLLPLSRPWNFYFLTAAIFQSIPTKWE